MLHVCYWLTEATLREGLLPISWGRIFYTIGHLKMKINQLIPLFSEVTFLQFETHFSFSFTHTHTFSYIILFSPHNSPGRYFYIQKHSTSCVWYVVILPGSLNFFTFPFCERERWCPENRCFAGIPRLGAVGFESGPLFCILLSMTTFPPHECRRLCVS